MRRLFTISLAIALVLAWAVPAVASTRSKIISDCSDDGQLQGRYSPSELRNARQHLPSDVAEYTDCADVLRRAELPDNGAAGGGAGGPATAPIAPGVPVAPGRGAAPPASAGATTRPLTPTTEQDRQALTDAHRSGSQPVTVDGRSLLPSTAALREGYKAKGLPSTLVIALIALALAGLALSMPPVRRLLRFRRGPR